MSSEDENRFLRQRKRNSAEDDLALESILGDYLISQDESEFLAELEKILGRDESGTSTGRSSHPAAGHGPVAPSGDDTGAVSPAQSKGTPDNEGGLVEPSDGESKHQGEAGESSLPDEAGPPSDQETRRENRISVDSDNRLALRKSSATNGDVAPDTSEADLDDDLRMLFGEAELAADPVLDDLLRNPGGVSRKASSFEIAEATYNSAKQTSPSTGYGVRRSENVADRDVQAKKEPDNQFAETEGGSMLALTALVLSLAAALAGGAAWWTTSGIERRFTELTSQLEDERRNREKAGAVVEELKVRIDELADEISPLAIELTRLTKRTAETVQPPRTLVLGPGSLLNLVAPVPLYISPDVADQPLMKAAPNTEVEIVEVSGSWWRVRVPDGVEGWVARDYLEVDQGRARVMTHLNVRLLPEVSERSARFSEHLNPGDEVRVVDQEGGWVRVLLPVRFTAWMHRQDFAHGAGMSGNGVNQPGS